MNETKMASLTPRNPQCPVELNHKPITSEPKESHANLYRATTA